MRGAKANAGRASSKHEYKREYERTRGGSARAGPLSFVHRLEVAESRRNGRVNSFTVQERSRRDLRSSSQAPPQQKVCAGRRQVMLKRIAITSLAAAAVFSSAAMASAWLTPAAAQVNIMIGAPPPAPVYEAAPPVRAGYVWAPGHYVLVNDRYVWTRGQYVAARTGYSYVPAS